MGFEDGDRPGFGVIVAVVRIHRCMKVTESSDSVWTRRVNCPMRFGRLESVIHRERSPAAKSFSVHARSLG